MGTYLALSFDIANHNRKTILGPSANRIWVKLAVRLGMPDERRKITIRRLNLWELRVRAVHHGVALQCRQSGCPNVATYLVDFRAGSEARNCDYLMEFCEKHAREVASAYNLELPE